MSALVYSRVLMRARALSPTAAVLVLAAALVPATVLGACSGGERPVVERPRVAVLDAGPPVALPEPEEDPRLDVPEDTSTPEGPACMRTSTCGPGQQCRGPSGCTSEWACGAERECLLETVAYCDCDEITFYAPGGCPGRPYAHVGACEAVGETIAAGTELGIHDWDEPPTDDARMCTATSECERGRTCWGVAGCATTWSCVRTRGCRRDSVEYCGCDGATFAASSTCPGRPFVHRGACRDAVAVAEPGIDGGAAASATERGGPSARERATASARERDAGLARAETSADAGVMSVASPEATTGCRSSRECPRREICQGTAGCGGEVEWRCAPPERECVADTQVFCDCEGQDFRASMFCPARPYRHRGSCEIDRVLDLSGAAVR